MSGWARAPRWCVRGATRSSRPGRPRRAGPFVAGRRRLPRRAGLNLGGVHRGHDAGRRRSSGFDVVRPMPGRRRVPAAGSPDVGMGPSRRHRAHRRQGRPSHRGRSAPTPRTGGKQPGGRGQPATSPKWVSVGSPGVSAGLVDGLPVGTLEGLYSRGPMALEPDKKPEVEPHLRPIGSLDGEGPRS